MRRKHRTSKVNKQTISIDERKTGTCISVTISTHCFYLLWIYDDSYWLGCVVLPIGRISRFNQVVFVYLRICFTWTVHVQIQFKIQEYQNFPTLNQRKLVFRIRTVHSNCSEYLNHVENISASWISNRFLVQFGLRLNSIEQSI